MIGWKKAASRAAAPVRLGRDAADAVDGELLQAIGLTARRLVDEAPLRVSLVALAAGGRLPPHRAAGPVTLHVLAGSLMCRAAASRTRLEPGDILALGAGVEHEVSSGSGTRFLLTVVDPQACPAASGAPGA